MYYTLVHILLFFNQNIFSYLLVIGRRRWEGGGWGKCRSRRTCTLTPSVTKTYVMQKYSLQKERLVHYINNLEFGRNSRIFVGHSDSKRFQPCFESSPRVIKPMNFFIFTNCSSEAFSVSLAKCSVSPLLTPACRLQQKACCVFCLSVVLTHVYIFKRS